jgi:acyl carrier protein
MELNLFVKHFAELFEETDADFIKPATKFRDIEEWSSLGALSVIAMADEKYKVSLTGDDIRKSVTIEDLFNVVQLKK